MQTTLTNTCWKRTWNYTWERQGAIGSVQPLRLLTLQCRAWVCHFPCMPRPPYT